MRWSFARRNRRREEHLDHLRAELHPAYPPEVESVRLIPPEELERVLEEPRPLSVYVQAVTQHHAPHGYRSAEVAALAVFSEQVGYEQWKAQLGRRLELIGEGLVVEVARVREEKTTIPIPDLGVRPELYGSIPGPTDWTVELRPLVRSALEVDRWVRLVGTTVFVEEER